MERSSGAYVGLKCLDRDEREAEIGELEKG